MPLTSDDPQLRRGTSPDTQNSSWAWLDAADKLGLVTARGMRL